MQKLIDQLGDHDFSKREAAANSLRGLGVSVLPALVKARKNPDPEVRRRVEELIPLLERAILFEPKWVTLAASKTQNEQAAEIARMAAYPWLPPMAATRTLKEQLAEITRQTGYPIVVSNADVKTRVDFSCTRMPFWEALDRLCDASGLGVSQTQVQDQVRVESMHNPVPYRSYDGIFRVLATGFNYRRSTNFGSLPRNPSLDGRGAQEFLTLNLLVGVEPKAPLLKLGRVKVTLAEDDQKRSMLAASNMNPWEQSYYYGGSSRNYVMRAQAHLSLPSRLARGCSRERNDSGDPAERTEAAPGHRCRPGGQGQEVQGGRRHFSNRRCEAGGQTTPDQNHVQRGIGRQQQL